MKSGYLPLILLLLASCGEQPSDKIIASSPEAPGIQQLLPIGEYRLAGTDGADINLGHGIGVTVTATEIAVASQCVTPRWSYRWVGGRIQTDPVQESICERGRYPAEDALFAVFDDPTMILKTPTNGYFIEGGGHSATLFPQ